MVILPIICHAQTLEEALGYGLPVVVVNTVNGEEPTAERIDAPEGCIGYGITNATKVPGRVRIYLPGDASNPAYDSGEYVDGKSGMTIKIRGNTSGTATAKKPFKLKLQKKVDLLLRNNRKYGDKDWALLNTIPESMLFRCPITWMVGNKVAEIFKVTDWVPASMYVNLIVNNNYRGFYQLTETIKRNDKCRIDVEEATGYISEIDPYWWNEDINVGSLLLQTASHNLYKFTFKYPDNDDITEENLNDFKEYIDLFDASMEKGSYPLYIDVESCARWLLAHQLLGTMDGAGSNVYLIRRNDQSKLEMGPLWDFDSVFWVQGRWTNIMGYHYFKWMLQNSPNKLLAREMIRIWNTERERIMTEVTDFYESLPGSLIAKAIDFSIKSDFRRWYVRMDDMNTTVGRLRKWFSTRAEEIDSLMTMLNTIDGDLTYDSIDVTDEEPTSDKLDGMARKVLLGNHLYIIRNNETYSVNGQRITKGN